MYKNILIPLDGSELAEQSLDGIFELSHWHETKIILLQVLEIFTLSSSSKDIEYGRLKEKAEAYLNDIKAKLEKKGITDVELVIKRGKPNAEICSYTERDDVDFVAMTTHGVGGMMSWALGSVTEKVVRHSAKPVLIFRSK